jgi:hypothetical protein
MKEIIHIESGKRLTPKNEIARLPFGKPRNDRGVDCYARLRRARIYGYSLSLSLPDFQKPIPMPTMTKIFSKSNVLVKLRMILGNYA